MGKLDQKVALITGGARGIGKQIALTFAREGADIVIGDISEMGSVAQEVMDLGQKVITVRSDVAKKKDINSLVDAALDNFKKVDILVNNAAVNLHNFLLDMTEEDWDRVLAVNLKGTFLCTQAVARYMIKQKYGKIINISSTGGLRIVVSTGFTPYASSKAGVNQFTKVCAVELAPYGINVNAICPGPILTEAHYAQRTPEEATQHIEDLKKFSLLGRVGTPQDIANLALFLASDESSFMTGQIICMDGGQGGIMC
jgi:NAD(P)-dependent dehydrogenase (short-subunit alcohol dehydrogenase family)